MSDTPPPDDQLFGSRTALALGVALLVGFSGVVAFGVYDKRHRDSLEQVAYVPTSVGDTEFFPRPAELNGKDVLLTWKGNPLYAAANETREQANDEMVKAGDADLGGVTIYRRIGRDRGPKDDAGQIYVKVADEEFLPLQSQPQR